MEKFKRNKLQVVQVAAELIAALGVSKVISQIIENNTDPDSASDRLRIKIGSFVIGFMIVDIASTYVSNCVNGVINWFRETKEELEEAQSSEE